MEDLQKDKNVDDWIKCWKDKKYPHGFEVVVYRDWRDFLDFWLLKYPELPIGVAVMAYKNYLKGRINLV